MNQILLIRHAEAELLFPDEKRPLTAKGRKRAKLLGDWLATRHFYDAQTIYHSELTRAQQTAQIIADCAIETQLRLVELNYLKPEDNPTKTYHWIKTLQENSIIVGHNPHLSTLASLLLTGHPYQLNMHFKKTGCLLIESQANHFILNGYLLPRWLEETSTPTFSPRL